MDLDVDYATTLVAAVMLGIGFVLQQYTAGQEPESRFLSMRILTDLLGKPRWLLGIGCMIAGYLLAAWSIGHLELTLVEPLLATYLVWALVLAVPMSRQAVKLTEVAGALILIGGRAAFGGIADDDGESWHRRRNLAVVRLPARDFCRFHMTRLRPPLALRLATFVPIWLVRSPGRPVLVTIDPNAAVRSLL